MSPALAPPPARRGPAWASFHVFLPGRVEPFLRGPLLRGVKEERARGRLRRFFFLRYGEGGPHLRLRFLPTPGTPPEALGGSVEAWARAHAEAEAGSLDTVRVERHPYDRAALYFGETRASVYAELLNEATSWLALGLLCAPGGDRRSHRWLAGAGVVHVLLTRTARDAADLRAWLHESRGFARRAGRELGCEAPVRPDQVREAVLGPLGAALPKVAAALADHPAAARIPRLMRRARDDAASGSFVGVHALHLLLNKLGLSLADEDEIFGALLHFEDGRAG